MPKYRFVGRYGSFYKGQTLGPWQPGDEAELDEETAAWIGRDSPGVIEEAGEARQQKAASDRQAKAPAADRKAKAAEE